MAKIIDFPDVDKLKEEVKSLRKSLLVSSFLMTTEFPMRRLGLRQNIRKNLA